MDLSDKAFTTKVEWIKSSVEIVVYSEVAQGSWHSDSDGMDKIDYIFTEVAQLGWHSAREFS